MSDDRILKDGMEISDFIQGWIFRDLGEWSRLRTLFHLDATIEVTWFEGQFCTEHARFYDRIERRVGNWRILSRCCFYDMGTLTFPLKPTKIDEMLVKRQPLEYAALAYVLDKSGFPVRRAFPTRGSESERQINEAAQNWL